MDERTEVLICVGAAAASNCVPCFEHYFKKASAAGVVSEDIQEAVDLANKVKNGSHMVVKNSIRSIMGQEGQNDQPCSAECCSSPCK